MQNSGHQLGRGNDALAEVCQIDLVAVAHGYDNPFLRAARDLRELGRHFASGRSDEHDLALDDSGKLIFADRYVIALCGLKRGLIFCRQKQKARRNNVLFQNCTDERGQIFTFAEHGYQNILRHNIISLSRVF